MTDAQKLARVKLLLGISSTDEDELLSGYLDLDNRPYVFRGKAERSDA